MAKFTKWRRTLSAITKKVAKAEWQLGVPEFSLLSRAAAC